MDSVELSIFSSRLEAICDEMGATLKRAAFSPNIRDRLDFSCAIFNAQGDLCAQAAHIPVHLGSMAYAMGDVVKERDWQSGDMLVMNDPFLGGTHLPDVTLISPVFADDILCGFIANMIYRYPRKKPHRAIEKGLSAYFQMAEKLTKGHKDFLTAPELYQLLK